MFFVAKSPLVHLYLQNFERSITNTFRKKVWLKFMSLKQVHSLDTFLCWSKDTKRYMFSFLQTLFFTYSSTNFSYFSLYKHTTLLFTKNALLFSTAISFDFRLLLYRSKLSVFFVIWPAYHTDFFYKKRFTLPFKRQILEDLFSTWSGSWFFRGLRSLSLAPFLLSTNLTRVTGVHLFSDTMKSMFHLHTDAKLTNLYTRTRGEWNYLIQQKPEGIKDPDILKMKPNYDVVSLNKTPMYLFILNVLLPLYSSFLKSTYSLLILSLLSSNNV